MSTPPKNCWRGWAAVVGVPDEDSVTRAEFTGAIVMGVPAAVSLAAAAWYGAWGFVEVFGGGALVAALALSYAEYCDAKREDRVLRALQKGRRKG